MHLRLPAKLTKGNTQKIQLSEERRKRWLVALKRSDITENNKKWMRICEDHFINGKPADLLDVNHPDWIPSQNMGYNKSVSQTAGSRLERRENRNLKKETLMYVPDYASDLELINVETEAQNSPNSVSCQTELSLSDISSMEEVIKNNVIKMSALKKKLNNMLISEYTFENDDQKTNYYTGLPNFKALMILFSLIQNFLPNTSALTKFQQLAITLMHLRLNLDFTDLAHRFCISKTTSTRIFSSCLYVLYCRLHNFIFWPERDALITKIPNVFLQSFGRKIAVIIDCFEIFIEKPSNLLAAAQTWSHYKHHNTIKFLIGICPQGAITFISSAWGGRASDQHIIQHCGILEKLLPGDIVLCDRGFNIQNEVELYCAEVRMPAFKKGKQQLSALEVEQSRNVAHVRIHVERVISNLRQKFQILHNIIPVSVLSKNKPNTPAAIDQIVNVCCCLTNISASVIPFE